MPLKMIDRELGTQLDSVDSTNIWIRESTVPLGSWVVADEQTHGKGRSGHSWFAFGEEKIIFSAKLGVPFDEVSFPQLSLLFGGAILKSLLFFFPEKGKELRIKWPNDLYRGSKKIGGVLIETRGAGKDFELILGIGINFYASVVPPEIQDIADVLLDEPPLEGTKERIVQKLIEEINKTFLASLDSDSLWKEIDFIETFSYLQGSIIETKVQGRHIHGKVIGFSQHGFLVILTPDGEKIDLMDTGPDFRIIS